MHEDGLHEQILVRRKELDLFQSIFSTYPDICVFPTKDLYRKHPVKPDLWKFSGRLDDVIVLLNAEKFNPVDYESMISSHPATKSAIVGGHGKSQTYLLVEPMSVSEKDKENMEILSVIWPTVAEANRTCPAHARVLRNFVIFVDRNRGVQRAGKGTVQREATLGLYQEDIDRLYEAPALPNTSSDVLLGTKISKSKPLRQALIDIVSSCIELSGESMSTVDFFNIGLDSLQTVLLAKQINAYLMQSKSKSQPVTPQTVYANPCIGKLESALKDTTGSSIHGPPETEMQAIFEAYTHSLSRARGVPTLRHPKSSVVLLTGSTGSLGSYILDTLLSSPNVAHVYCLTRSPESKFARRTPSKSKG
ncbi:MAG: hypothetical protein Q9209_002499 [Squamulea sp. 1 TL-2023]